MFRSEKCFISIALKCCSVTVLLFFIAAKANGQIAEIRQLQASLPAIKDSIKYVDVLNRIGLLLHTKSADSCFYYGMKAQNIAERLQYNKGRAEAFVNIAITLTLKGMHSQGLSYYIKARDIFLKEGHPEPATELLMNCAISYDFLGNYNRSLQFAKRALKESEKLKKDSVKSMLIANYVNIDTSLTEAQSDKYLDNATVIANKYKDDRTILFIKQLKAYTLLDNNKPDAALPYIRQSLAIAHEHQLEYHEMEGLYVYASYYKAKGNADSALNCYQTIYKMALANNYVFWQIEILELLKDAYKQKNNTPAQLRANDSLVSALKKQNASSNNFIGDYIEYN
ncbi:MAG: tetratricopeptide repeat protein, partial [Sphingobacteriaceae bacterium]